ncbi:MAG: hemagglutinin repeat-containing protein, partial [Propionivibrio sp.]
EFAERTEMFQSELDVDETLALATTFSGNTTELSAGNDLMLHGSNAVASGDLTLTAGHDLTLESAAETRDETHFRKTKQSGLFGSGGIGFTIGSRMQSTDQQSDGNTAAASTVGSTDGNVSLTAGESYRQVGSDVIAPQGDIDIRAKRVHIAEARETSRSSFETKTQQSGLTLAITSPIISAIQTVQQMSEAASHTQDSRMQALAAANVGLSAYSTYEAIDKGQGSKVTIDGVTQDNQIVTKTDANGKALESRDANAADKVGGINLSISLGASSSSSKTTQTSDAASGSNLAAGGDLKITASGAGQDSDITVQGSTLSAGKNLVLTADDQIQLLAAQNTADQHGTNQNSSASVGISFGTDGLMFNIGARGGRGKANGDDLAWTNTHVTAGDTLTLDSGGDTTLKGAVAQGERVIAKVGGNLAIESLQDQSTYDSKQQSAGFSLSIGYGKMSGSLSLSQSKVSSDYASVSEQSGIKAGDKGFQVAVAGDTKLKGGIIASSQAAVDDDLNRFATGGTLTTEDIQNHAEYEATSTSINLGSSMSFDGALTPGGAGAGFGQDDGSADSTTKAGISGVAGNSAIRTGDAETGIARIFDADKVQKDIEAQTQITQLFGQQASQAVGGYAQNQRKDLQEQLKNATPEDRIALQEQIKEVNLQERVMNVLIGAVSGMGASAVTKETLSAAAEEMRRITIENSQESKGIVDGTFVLTNFLTGKSEGLRGDGHGTGGTRLDFDNICGPTNERCKTITDTNGNKVLDLKDGMVQWDKEGAKGLSLAAYPDSPEGQKAAGATGGIQGWKGALFGRPYAAGSWQDKLIESFGGTHDFIGGQVTGLYDGQGNTKRGMSDTERFVRDRVSEAALVPSAPFAAAELLTPEVWKAISIFVKAAK